MLNLAGCLFLLAAAVGSSPDDGDDETRVNLKDLIGKNIPIRHAETPSNRSAASSPGGRGREKKREGFSSPTLLTTKSPAFDYLCSVPDLPNHLISGKASLKASGDAVQKGSPLSEQCLRGLEQERHLLHGGGVQQQG